MRQLKQGETAAARGQRGIALVAVLWITVLLALLAASFARTTRNANYLARNLTSGAEARALADAGVYRAIAGLLERAPERQLALDGSPYRVGFAAGQVLLKLQDEGGKIDLNRAPGAMFAKLFLTVGVSEDDSAALADAIVDYRDGNHDRHLHGAEDDDYKAAGLPRGAKDAPFEAIEELRQVLGMNEGLYQLVAPAITVWGRGRRVNRATAPPLVLRALPGMDEAALVERLEARDRGSQSLDSTDEGETDSDEPQSRPVRQRRAGAVTVTSEAHTANGAVFIREAVVSTLFRRGRAPGDRSLPYQILAWREGQQPVQAAPAGN